MTTTELIDLLKKNEHGGATGRPREVMICIGDEIYDTDITSISTGDGLITELFLDITPKTEQRTGRWIDYTEDGYVECPFCHSATNCDDNKDELHYCFSCGAELR